MNRVEGTENKGGTNPPNTSKTRPPAPGGSGRRDEIHAADVIRMRDMISREYKGEFMRDLLLVVKHPGRLTKDAKEKLKAEVEASFNGEKHPPILIIEEGMDVQLVRTTEPLLVPDIAEKYPRTA